MQWRVPDPPPGDGPYHYSGEQWRLVYNICVLILTILMLFSLISLFRRRLAETARRDISQLEERVTRLETNRPMAAE